MHISYYFPSVFLLIFTWHQMALFSCSWLECITILMVRSLVANPKSKGVIYGLTLDTSENHLALLYLATIQVVAYVTRPIVEHCNAHGHKVLTCYQGFRKVNWYMLPRIYIFSSCIIDRPSSACSGLAKNSVYIQEHADVIGKSPLPAVISLHLLISLICEF